MKPSVMLHLKAICHKVAPKDRDLDLDRTSVYMLQTPGKHFAVTRRSRSCPQKSISSVVSKCRKDLLEMH